MASAGKRLGHQDQAEIVVGLAVAGINTQDLSKLFFRQIEFFLSDVNVSQIVMSSSGIGIELQRVLKRFQSVVVVLFAAVCDSQQVVTLHAGGIQLELLLDLHFSFGDRSLAQQGLSLEERRCGFRSRAGGALDRRGLLSLGSCSKNEDDRERQNAAQSRPTAHASG